MTNSHQVAQRIESLLRIRGLSKSWLSDDSGIADKTLRRRFRAPEHFTLAELSSIANSLGVPVEVLFGAGPVPALGELQVTDRIAA